MSVTAGVRTTALPSGEVVPVLGQGTWLLGRGARERSEEVAAVRRGLDAGMTLIDTGELYGDGECERVVGAAIAGRRDEVFLVSKVLPYHATADGVVAACRGSLERLRTDRIDLYLLHWRGRVPLQETLEGFARLADDGLIRYWGVGNFVVADLAELVRIPGGEAVATDQILFSLAHRTLEYDVVPWCLERGMPVMAYSPIEQDRLLSHKAVATVARRHDATPAQVAVAWVLEHEHVIAIPQAGTPDLATEHRGVLDLKLAAADLAELDEAFPPPLWPGRPRAF